MTERSSEGLDERRRKVLFRAWQRGVREIDLIVGRFADAHIATLDAAALDDFERLIEAPNAELYAWVVGTESAPAGLRYRRARKAQSVSHGDPYDARRGGTVTARTRSTTRSPAERLAAGRPLLLSGVADGAEGLVLADLARSIAAGRARAAGQPRRDLPRRPAHGRARRARSPSSRPTSRCWNFPPGIACRTTACRRMPGVVAQRMTALARLARVKGRERPAVVLTTVNAILQRVPPREVIARQSLSAAPGNLLPMAGVTQWLELNGFNRAATVREPGDYAVRGGIVDLFAPGMAAPVRLDFFGDTLETIRSFDPETQRTTDELRALDLVPMAEFQLTTETIRRSAPAMSRSSAPPAPTTCSTRR